MPYAGYGPFTTFYLLLAVDLLDGDKQRGPTIRHRGTLCNRIYLDEVLDGVNKCAFDNNE